MKRAALTVGAVAIIVTMSALVAAPAWADDPSPIPPGGDPTTNPPLPVTPAAPAFGQPLQSGDGSDIPVTPIGPYSTPPPAPIAFGPVPPPHLALPPAPLGRSAAGTSASARSASAHPSTATAAAASTATPTTAIAAAPSGPTLQEFVRSLLRPGARQVGTLLERRPPA